MIVNIRSRENERCVGLAGARLALCVSCVLSANQSVLAESRDKPLDRAAYEACVPAGSTSVQVLRDEQGGVFASSGERYFAGDLYRPRNASGARDDTTGAAAPRLEAVPAGEENRWGLRPAWIVVDGGKGKQLLQAVRLLRGEALFAPDRAEGACAEILRQAEAEARSKSAGLWGDKNAAPIYSTARPEPLKKMTGYYVIATGRIVSLGKTERTRYLNFGNYWKTDFTVTLNASDEALFDAALAPSGWQVDALAGATVELRGIVQEWDGPHIALHHPEQLVVLEDKRAARGGR